MQRLQHSLTLEQGGTGHISSLGNYYSLMVETSASSHHGNTNQKYQVKYGTEKIVHITQKLWRSKEGHMSLSVLNTKNIKEKDNWYQGLIYRVCPPSWCGEVEMMMCNVSIVAPSECGHTTTSPQQQQQAPSPCPALSGTRKQSSGPGQYWSSCHGGWPVLSIELHCKQCGHPVVSLFSVVTLCSTCGCPVHSSAK